MDPVQAFLLGLLQGVTEWLPISSSGMTTVSASGLGVPAGSALAFAFFLHFGTLFAVLVRLHRDVRDVVVAIPRWRTSPVVKFLAATTAISVLVGLALRLTLHDAFGEHEPGGVAVTVFVGVLLVVTGLVIRAARDRGGDRDASSTGPGDWLLLGLAQGFAVLPGISRSGMTVSALLIRRVEATESLRLSFLMAIPAITAVVAYELVWGDVLSFGYPAVLAGVVASFVFGLVTIDVLMRVSRRMRWDLFCVAFGGLAIIAGMVLFVL